MPQSCYLQCYFKLLLTLPASWNLQMQIPSTELCLVTTVFHNTCAMHRLNFADKNVFLCSFTGRSVKLT